MARKHINCHRVVKEDAESETIREILDWVRLIESDLDEDVERNHISLQIGNRSAKTYFCPTTWDGAEMLAEYVICHLIYCNADIFSRPYFEELFNKYSKHLSQVSFKDDGYLWDCTTR